MLNKVMLIGRLGKDPELRHTTSGTAVASFSVATTEKYKDKSSGEQRENTEWHNIVMWGKLAEIAGQYLVKGSLAYLEGKLQTRKWEDSSGTTKYTTEIVCDTMKMLSKNERSGSGGAGGGSHEEPPYQDDDIPY